MATRPKQEPKSNRRRPVATTPEAEENRMIGLAMELAAKQLEQGTASAQVTTHFLKLGSSREKLEQEKIRLETELVGAKTEAMASAQRIEELYGQALNAMRSYAGGPPLDSGADDDEYAD